MKKVILIAITFASSVLCAQGVRKFNLDFYNENRNKGIEIRQKIESLNYKANSDREFDKGSNISISSLNRKRVDDLCLLGKIWGLLKYHHPKVASGEYNWDYELLRFVQKYLAVKEDSDRDQLLIDWIKSYGDIQKDHTYKHFDSSVFLKPDHSWLEAFRMDSRLREVLVGIVNSSVKTAHFYIRMVGKAGKPEFLNENPYFDMYFPDDGFRLLALYRYWNVIHYFYPYRHLIDKDWHRVMKEYLPRFLNVRNELEYETLTLQLIGEITDTHANIYEGSNRIEDKRGEFYAPFHLRFVEGKLVVVDYYNPELKEETKLEIGDVITHIQNKSVKKILDSIQSYYPASNKAARLRNISNDLLRSTEQAIDIRYKSKGSDKTKTTLRLYNRDSLNRYRWYPEYVGQSYKFLEDSIGYISLQSIRVQEIVEIKSKFRNAKGIIIDIRNYPSAFVVFSLGSYLVSSTTPFVKFTKGSISNPGEFNFTRTHKIPSTSKHYKGRVVILVNEFTQSHGEYTAMALSAGSNSTIIGSTTAGADGNVSDLVLPGGIKTKISGIGVYFPDGRETQRIGIVPDIEVSPSLNGIRHGKDELLEKALQLINKDKGE